MAFQPLFIRGWKQLSAYEESVDKLDFSGKEIKLFFLCNQENLFPGLM